MEEEKGTGLINPLETTIRGASPKFNGWLEDRLMNMEISPSYKDKQEQYGAELYPDKKALQDTRSDEVSFIRGLFEETKGDEEEILEIIAEEDRQKKLREELVEKYFKRSMKVVGDNPQIDQVERARSEAGILADERVQLENKANLDKTGLLRKEVFEETMQRELERSPEGGVWLEIDIDNLKKVNDNHRGKHAAGDLFIQTVADALVSSVRRTDLVFRMGGDELGVWLRNAKAERGLQTAQRIGEGVVSGVEEAFFEVYGDENFFGSVSTGVALRKVGDTPQSLRDRGDHGASYAKEQGKNRIVLSEDVPDDFVARSS